MNADLERLILLQAIDLELSRLRTELAAVPSRLKAAEKARCDAEAALARIDEAMRKEETLRRSQESDVRTHKDKLARLRRQLDAATSTAQVTALEHEIGFAEQAISRLEDEELASMERTEQFEVDRNRAVQTLEQLAAALLRESASGEELTARHQHRVVALEAERSGVRSEVGATDSGERLLSQYDRLAKSRGTALSEASDHKCSACQMMLRAQRWNDLTDRDPNSPHRDEVQTCETCGRMLFYDPRRDTPGPWPAGERLAAARG